MCLVASFISSLVTRTRGGTMWGVGLGPARIEPCGGRQAVVGAPRGDGTGRYCSNKRRKIAHNWLEEGSRYHRYGKQGRIKLFLCINRIPGCLPAAAGPPPPFDAPTSLVGLAQPASFCHLCLPLKMLRPGILCFLKVSKRCWAGCWRTSQAAIRNKYPTLARDDSTLDPADTCISPLLPGIRCLFILPTQRRNTTCLQSLECITHSLLPGRARARCSTATTQSPVFSCLLRDS